MLVGTFLTCFGNGMTLPFLFVYMTRVRHIDSIMVGVIIAWMGVLGLILGGPIGAMIDRFGARRIILPLFVCSAIGTAGYGFVHTPWQALATATLCAAGNAGLWSGQNTMMVGVTTEAERHKVFGLSFAILNLGIGIGGVVAGFIADVHRPDSFRVLYLVDGATTLIPMLIVLALRSVGGPVVAATEKKTKSGGYREVFANRAFRRFAIFTVVLMSCAYAQMEVGFPAYASIAAGVPPKTIAWAFAGNTATIVLAQLFVLKHMHGRSRSRALAVVGVIIAASWLILGAGAATSSGPAIVPMVCVVLCSVVFACGETLMSPILPAVTNALATDELRGRYNAISGMSWGITGIIGPLTAAPLIGHGHASIWLMLVICGALAASALALSLRRLLTPKQDGIEIDELTDDQPAGADLVGAVAV
jgi:MFS family permease